MAEVQNVTMLAQQAKKEAITEITWKEKQLLHYTQEFISESRNKDERSSGRVSEGV